MIGFHEAACRSTIGSAYHARVDDHQCLGLVVAVGDDAPLREILCFAP